MNFLSLMSEAAALAGYTISGTNTQDVANKIRAQRRVNVIKADIIGRYGGKWPSNYREGWLPLVALYNTGTATFTQNSVTVTGSGTVWTTSMKGSKILGGDNAYYKIASVQSSTSLTLTQPYQSSTTAGQVYQIWQDEYRLYPDVMNVGGFIDYFLPQRADEAWVGNMKESYPFPTSLEEPTVYTVIGRKGLTSTLSSGTVTTVSGSNVVTGAATTWLSGSTQMEPGMKITINSVDYTVSQVNSDTELETAQLLKDTVNAATYSAVGRNCLVIRFRKPTNQRVVHYWYYTKDAPFVNDSDEDWIAEMYPRVIVDGMAYFDFLDKNDVPRAMNSRTVFENSIKDMKVAVEEAFTGIRTLGIYVPPAARD